MSDQEQLVSRRIADADDAHGGGGRVEDRLAHRTPARQNSDKTEDTHTEHLRDNLQKLRPDIKVDSYEAPAPAMETERGDPHLAQNFVDRLQVRRDQPLLRGSRCGFGDKRWGWWIR